MIKPLAISGLPMALAIFLGACGPSTNPGTGGGSDPTPSVTAIHVASSGAVGTYLTTATGLTLYYFTPERDSHAAAPHIVCTGSCATTWPPIRNSAPPTKRAQALAGVTNPGLLVLDAGFCPLSRATFETTGGLRKELVWPTGDMCSVGRSPGSPHNLPHKAMRRSARRAGSGPPNTYPARPLPPSWTVSCG